MMDKNSTVLIVMAHPDDAELLCFGTILALVRSGASVTLAIASMGSRGITMLPEEETGASELHPRWQETLNAFSGVAINILCLNLDDGTLTFSIDLISKIEGIFHEVKPNLVITHYVDKTGGEHQDHNAVGMATLNVARRSTSTEMILQPHPYTLNSTLTNFDLFVDITEVFDEKLTALKQHQSQQHKHYFYESYQRFIGEYHAMSAGHEYFVERRLFERFTCSKFVIRPGFTI